MDLNSGVRGDLVAMGMRDFLQQTMGTEQTKQTGYASRTATTVFGILRFGFEQGCYQVAIA